MTPVYLVFGATGGVGSALTRKLVQSGAKVIAAGRNQQKLDALNDELGVMTISGDATNSEMVAGAFYLARQRYKDLQGVVNCVAWQQAIETNLAAASHIVSEAAKAMSGAGGSVVLVSSPAGAKAGAAALTIDAAAQHAEKKIRVNCVAPASLAMHALATSDVALAIALFLDGGNSTLTGQVLDVGNGGTNIDAHSSV
jgi:NAD(P)-dependent dehydrogenase (short-subunit alcohol dehydrogenase family)